MNNYNKSIFCLTLLAITTSNLSFSQPGSLDPTFNGTGMVTTDFGASQDRSNAVAIQSDGKIIAAGESQFGSGTGFSLVRLNTDGTLDNTFGNNGIVSTLLSNNNINVGIDDKIQAIAIQPDGKIVVTGRQYPSEAAVVRYNTDGSIDVTFGTNGIAVATGINWAYDIELQSNGKIVIVGESRDIVHNNTAFGVSRLNADGTPDNTFGNNGHQQTAIADDYYSDIARSLAIQSDGKIVLAGYTYNGTIQTFALVRYISDGSLDASFDGDGIINDTVFSSHHYAYSVAVQNDGKIIAAGTTQNTTTLDDEFALVRYNSNGSLDSTFSDDARVTNDIGAYDDNLSAMIIQPDGKIVAGGTSYTTTSVFSLVRYNEDGTPDLTFSDDGVQTIANWQTTGYLYLSALAIASDGKIVASGTSSNYAITRCNSDGSLDNTFNNTGVLELSLKLGNDKITSMLIQPDGKIITLGKSGYLSPVYGYLSNAPALCRYHTNGILDTDFGVNGISIHESLGGTMALQDDGKILVNSGFGLCRLKVDGTVDSTFGTDGYTWVWDFFIGAYNSSVASIIVQPDGKIIAAGYAQEPGMIGDKYFALARFNVDGTIDSTFGTDGKVLTNLTLDYDEIRSLALQPDGKIIAAGLAGSRFGLVRYNANGSPDNSFGSNGIVTTAIGTPWYDIANAVTIQPDGKIIAAGTSQTTTTPPIQFSFALVRYLTNGTLDATFGNNGKVINDFGNSWNETNSIALQTDGKIIATGSTGTNDYSHIPQSDFALLRLNTDGTPDNSFGNNGNVITDFAGGDDQAFGMVLDDNGKILLGGYTTGSFDSDFALARYQTDSFVGFETLIHQENNALVYTNPVSDLLTIKSDISKGGYYLYDISGKTMLQGNVISPSFSLDLSNLSSGVYFISVTDGKQQVNGKIIKQ